MTPAAEQELLYWQYRPCKQSSSLELEIQSTGLFLMPKLLMDTLKNLPLLALQYLFLSILIYENKTLFQN